jgi:hypothetical protein
MPNRWLFSKLERVVRETHENKEGFKLSGTHQLMVYAVYVYLSAKNTYTINENTSFIACKEVGVGVNAERIKYVFMSC